MLDAYLDQFTELCAKEAPYALVVEGIGVRSKLGETMDGESNQALLDLLYKASPSLVKKLRVLNTAQLQQGLELTLPRAVQAMVLCSLLHHPTTTQSIFELDAPHGVLLCRATYVA